MIIQKFRCVVHEINDQIVTLIIKDLTDKSRLDECWSVNINKFKEKDRANIKPGNVYFFKINDKNKGWFIRQRPIKLTEKQLQKIEIVQKSYKISF